MNQRTIIIVRGLVIALIAAFVAYEGFKWTVMRVYVPHDKALMVINKFGDALPADMIVVPKDGQFRNCKGVQEELRGPGRYFLNPVEYDYKLVDLVEIPAGDPQLWRFTHDGALSDDGHRPMIGLVSVRQGKTPPSDMEVVDPGFKGLQKEVLTPGVYKLNPQVYEVTKSPATVVPPGYVGVVTQLVGKRGAAKDLTLSEIRSKTSGPATRLAAATSPVSLPASPSRLVVNLDERGVRARVLQPGIYYFNPRLNKVDVVPCGYDAITINKDVKKSTSGIRFYSGDGYQVEADFTVVWGVSPADAPEIVANIGGWDLVRMNVIEPAMKAACQNVGAKYTSKELIQGATRSKFQDELSASLEQTVQVRKVHVLLALIRNIAIRDNTGKDATLGLLATIQRANIEIEKDLTNKQKTQTAVTAAKLEQALKNVDVAKETVASDTQVKVANIGADAAKLAAETDAQRDLDVATVNLEIAQLDAKRTQILGKAQADVTRMKSEAEAKGAKLLVDAFGSAQAYNLYTFAKGFEPKDLKLIFAGPGTFWTDLKTFQEIGASEVVKQAQEKKK
jgi:regulator of protease activity HflC (stomatin/prohibitin superfamily)